MSLSKRGKLINPSMLLLYWNSWNISGLIIYSYVWRNKKFNLPHISCVLFLSLKWTYICAGSSLSNSSANFPLIFFLDRWSVSDPWRSTGHKIVWIFSPIKGPMFWNITVFFSLTSSFVEKTRRWKH